MALDPTALTVIEGDARIADTHLQQVLGYARINDLHRIIKKHEVELGRYGQMLCRSGKASSGQTRLTYFLTEGQATLVCMFARTGRAADARQIIIEVFTAWRKGQLAGVASPEVDPFAFMAGRSGQVRDHLAAIAAMPDLARNVTHLPIWSNGQRPHWWGDYALRTFLTQSHRQMTLAACCAEVERRFGRKFSGSTLQRYWAKLDRVVGPQIRRIA
jgi:hypothetical protein